MAEALDDLAQAVENFRIQESMDPTVAQAARITREALLKASKQSKK